MKISNLIRGGLWLFLGVAPCALHASISISSSINGVALGGSHELAGSYAIVIKGDEFAGASPGEPIYIRLALDKNAVFSQTRVNLTSADATAARPIFLPLTLNSDHPEDTLQAPPETAAIVRWVAGENAIWLRIQSDADNWITLADGAASAPGPNLSVRMALGVSARIMADSLGAFPLHRRNLPFPTRFPGKSDLTPEDAVSTIFCMDLGEAEDVVYSQDPLLYLDPFAFGAEAEVAPGLFEPNQPRPEINFGGVLAIARVQRRSCRVQAQDPRPTIVLDKPPPALTVSALSNILDLDISRRQANDIFDLNLHSGSRFILSTGHRGPYGFAGDVGRFLDPDHGGIVALSDPVDVDGQTLYQTLSLTWQGGFRPLTDFQLGIEATLRFSCAAAPMDLILNWRLELVDHAGAEGAPPFDGPDQMVRCPQSTAWAEDGLWHFGSVGAPFASNRLAPHLTRPLGQFQTQITLANLRDEAQSGCLLTAYNQVGQPISSVHRQLAPRETLQASPLTLFSVADAAYVAILEAPAVEVGLVYRADRENVGLAHLRASEVRANVWRLYPGQPELTWDGIALVNLGDDMAEVKAAQIRFGGQEADRRTISRALAPGEKALYVLSDAFDYLTDAYFQIESSQPLGLIALRGDLDSTLMWENPVTPVK